MVDNYLVFGAPQESGPSRGWGWMCVSVLGGGMGGGGGAVGGVWVA